MINKKNRFAFLFSLFTFLSISGFATLRVATSKVANSIDKHQQENGQSEKTSNISSSSGSNDNPNIGSIEGILQTSIKINENNSPVFQNSKNSKRYSTFKAGLQSFLFSKSYYACYCSDLTNRINTCPFYLTYRRLII